MSTTLLHTALAVGGVIVGITATLALTPSPASPPTSTRASPVPIAQNSPVVQNRKNGGYVLPTTNSRNEVLVPEGGAGRVIVPSKIGASFSFAFEEVEMEVDCRSSLSAMLVFMTICY